MARIRSIKPQFFSSEQVVECSPRARLLFVGLWCFSDDYGVHPSGIKRAKMEVFPADDVKDEEIQTCIDELIERKLIRAFEDHGKIYWWITGWQAHQKVDKPSKARFAAPPAEWLVNNSESSSRQVDESAESDRRSVADSSTRNGMDGSGVEGKGREFSSNQKTESSTTTKNHQQAASAHGPNVGQPPSQTSDAGVTAPGWGVVAERLKNGGLNRVDSTVKKAKSLGYQPEQIMAWIEHVESAKDIGVGAIRDRLDIDDAKKWAPDFGWNWPMNPEAKPGSTHYPKGNQLSERDEAQLATLNDSLGAKLDAMDGNSVVALMMRMNGGKEIRGPTNIEFRKTDPSSRLDLLRELKRQQIATADGEATSE